MGAVIESHSVTLFLSLFLQFIPSFYRLCWTWETAGSSVVGTCPSQRASCFCVVALYGNFRGSSSGVLYSQGRSLGGSYCFATVVSDCMEYIISAGFPLKIVLFCFFLARGGEGEKVSDGCMNIAYT